MAPLELAHRPVTCWGILDEDVTEALSFRNKDLPLKMHQKLFRERGRGLPRDLLTKMHVSSFRKECSFHQSDVYCKIGAEGRNL